jgi:SNF2 family DNA or RNA helicase
VGAEYSISKENLARIMDIIKPLVSWVKKSECLDLPDQIDEVRSVELGDNQRRAYREMKAQLITEIQGHAITAPMALTKLLKLREITSGFAFDVAGQEVAIGECPKLRDLEDLLEEAGDQPVMIWAVFKWDIAQICAFLVKKYGIGCYRTLYSGTADHQGSIDDFKGGKSRFLVANPASAAHGLTFVNSCLQVFYSLDYSLERYEQAKARIHRAGQTQKCTYVHLVARGTIDEDIMRILREKGDISRLTFDMFKTVERRELQEAAR